MMVTPSVLPDGTWIDNFRIVRRLGRGGFGVTYLADEFREWESGGNIGTPLRQVAIKEYYPRGLVTRPNGHTVALMPDVEGAEQTFQQALKGFFTEAESLMRFDHPSVIKIHRVFQRNGTAYYVMPFLRGESLKSLIKRDGAMGEERARRLLMPVLDGLIHAHAKGILHRDLKPDNVMIPDEGPPVLIDFGAARAETAEDAQQYTRHSELVAYTPGYAAFEQYGRATRENLHGAHTDVYGLAAVLYHAITGDVPIDAARRAMEIANGHPDPLIPASVRLMDQPGYGRAFLTAIDWALEVAGRHRPQTLAEFRKALDGRVDLPDHTLDRLAQHGVSTEPFTRPVFSGNTRAGGHTRPTRSDDPPPESGDTRVVPRTLAGATSAAPASATRPVGPVADPARADTVLLSPPATEAAPQASADAPAAPPPPPVPPPSAAPAATPAGDGRSPILMAALIALVAAGGYIAFQQGLFSPGSGSPPVVATAPSSAPAPVADEAPPLAVVPAPEPEPALAPPLDPAPAPAADPVEPQAQPKPAPAPPPAPAVAKADPVPAPAASPKKPPAAATAAPAPAAATPRATGSFRDCPECPDMLRVRGGDFEMGDRAGSGEADEKPVRSISVASLSVAVTETTFDQWEACLRDGGCSTRPSDAGWGRGARPVISVSWNDARQYAAWLSRKTGKRYRLPSEAEFEYYNRAGGSTEFPWGRDAQGACRVANVADLKARQGNPEWNVVGCDDGQPVTAPVGSYRPNPLGLYDVSGNVWEWTADCDHRYEQTPADGAAFDLAGCVRRIIRGGSWSDGPANLRASARDRSSATRTLKIVGFRVVRD